MFTLRICCVFKHTHIHIETHIIVTTLCTQSAVSVIPDFLGFPQTHYTRIPSDFPQESSDPLLVVRKHVCISKLEPLNYCSDNFVLTRKQLTQKTFTTNTVKEKISHIQNKDQFNLLTVSFVSGAVRDHWKIMSFSDKWFVNAQFLVLVEEYSTCILMLKEKKKMKRFVGSVYTKQNGKLNIPKPLPPSFHPLLVFPNPKLLLTALEFSKLFCLTIYCDLGRPWNCAGTCEPVWLFAPGRL